MLFVLSGIVYYAQFPDYLTEPFLRLVRFLDAGIQELELIISVAKQAEFQHPDVKVETLTDTIDSIRRIRREKLDTVFKEGGKPCLGRTVWNPCGN